MSKYTDFFLNGKSSVVQLELLEISHPVFTKTYRIVRNAVDGVTVKLEDATYKKFDYYPLKITFAETRDNLDSAIRVDLGDLGTVIPKEIDWITGGWNEAFLNNYPVVKYRTYRSDDLESPLFGPIVLQVTSFDFNKEGCSFEAKAPQINLNKTGEYYTLQRFPMLRGFV